MSIEEKIKVHEHNIETLYKEHTSIVTTTLLDDKASVIVLAHSKLYLIEKKQLMIAGELNRLRAQLEKDIDSKDAESAKDESKLAEETKTPTNTEA